MARTQRLFYTTSQHCWGQGSGAAGHTLPGSALCGEPFTPYVCTLTIVAVTVHFLISLLFPVDFSSISSQPSPFVPPILFSSHPQR